MIAVALLTLLLSAPPEPPPPPAEPAQDSPNAIRDRVAKGMAQAEGKLHEKDTGDETRSLQTKILKDIDALIALLKNPPPTGSAPEGPSAPFGEKSDGSKNKTGAPTPQGGGSPSTRPQAGNSRRDQRKARRDEKMTEQGSAGAPNPGKDDGGMAANPKPDGEPSTGKEGGGKPPDKNGPPPQGGPAAMSEVAKDVWGHLPETLRQEVDHYYRDQFMPRYRELLQQYYSRLSETPKEKK